MPWNLGITQHRSLLCAEALAYSPVSYTRARRVPGPPQNSHSVLLQLWFPIGKKHWVLNGPLLAHYVAILLSQHPNKF